MVSQQVYLESILKIKVIITLRFLPLSYPMSNLYRESNGGEESEIKHEK